MRMNEQLPNITGVESGGSAAITIPIGRTIDKVLFNLTNITPVQMKFIKLHVDGKVIQEWKDGSVLSKINAYYGRPDSAGFLSWYFVRDWMANLMQKRRTGLGTGTKDVGFLSSVQITFEIDAAAVNPKVTASCVMSEPSPFGEIVKVKRIPGGSGTAGQLELDKIMKGPKIGAIHIQDVDAVNNTKPSDMEISVDSVRTFKASITEVNENLKGVRVPQDDMFHVDYVQEGEWEQALITAGVQDFRVIPTLPEAGKFEIIVEYLDVWKGI